MKQYKEKKIYIYIYYIRIFHAFSFIYWPFFNGLAAVPIVLGEANRGAELAGLSAKLLLSGFCSRTSPLCT